MNACASQQHMSARLRGSCMHVSMRSYSCARMACQTQSSLSILCQLQRLFARLQLSLMSAISSAGLTSAFGWRGDDVYLQHDVQELMHVMFDALQQQHGASRVGQFLTSACHGTMCDYVQCMTCHTRRERMDTFMDLSMDVKGLSSLHESFQQFIKPDVLEGRMPTCVLFSVCAWCHVNVMFSRCDVIS